MSRFDRLRSVLDPAARAPAPPVHRTASAARRHAEGASGVPFVEHGSEAVEGGFAGVATLRPDQEYLRQRIEERGVPCLPRREAAS